MEMEKQHTAESLKRMIAELEEKQKNEAHLLKEELEYTIDNFKPVNILKSLLKEFYSSEKLLDEIINTAVSVTSGFVAKKVVIGRSKNQFLRLIGMALQFGMTTVIAKKFHQIKENINQFIAHFFGEKDETEVNDAESKKETTSSSGQETTNESKDKSNVNETDLESDSDELSDK